MKRISLVILLSFLLGSGAGCATSYQQLDKNGYGYNDYQELSTNKFRIDFTANCYTSPATIERYEFQRARELCDERSFSRYRLIDEMPIHEQSMYISRTETPQTSLAQTGYVQYTPVFSTTGVCYRRGSIIIECADKKK